MLDGRKPETKMAALLTIVGKSSGSAPGAKAVRRHALELSAPGSVPFETFSGTQGTNIRLFSRRR